MSEDVVISVVVSGVIVMLMLAADHLQRHPPHFRLRSMLIVSTAIALALGLVMFRLGK
jgi:hypothetical protein